MGRIASEVIPSCTKLPVDGSERPEILALGIRFGAEDPQDPLFREAYLPEGWTREAGTHGMSHVVDERGFQRVMVFYKAEVYDRTAFMRGIDIATDVVWQCEEGRPIRWDLLTEAEKLSVRNRLRAEIEGTEHRLATGRGRAADPIRLARLREALEHVGGPVPTYDEVSADLERLDALDAR